MNNQMQDYLEYLILARIHQVKLHPKHKEVRRFHSNNLNKHVLC